MLFDVLSKIFSYICTPEESTTRITPGENNVKKLFLTRVVKDNPSVNFKKSSITSINSDVKDFISDSKNNGLTHEEFKTNKSFEKKLEDKLVAKTHQYTIEDVKNVVKEFIISSTTQTTTIRTTITTSLTFTETILHPIYARAPNNLQNIPVPFTVSNISSFLTSIFFAPVRYDPAIRFRVSKLSEVAEEFNLTMKIALKSSMAIGDERKNYAKAIYYLRITFFVSFLLNPFFYRLDKKLFLLNGAIGVISVVSICILQGHLSWQPLSKNFLVVLKFFKSNQINP